VLELNNTDAYLKVVEMHLPNLVVVTTLVCSSGKKKKILFKEKTTLGKKAPNLSLYDSQLNYLRSVSPITHRSSKVSANKYSQTHKLGLGKQVSIVASRLCPWLPYQQTGKNQHRGPR